MKQIFNSLILPVIVCVLLAGCEKQPPPVQNDAILSFGTIIDVSLYGVDKPQAAAAMQALNDDFNYMHVTWHAWRPGALGRTNELLALQAEFSLAPSVLPLIKRSTELYKTSQGLFNPAIGKLIELWGFHSDELPSGPPPDQAEIQAILDMHPSMDDIEFTDISMQGHNKSMHLDFGGIGKGMAVDIAVEHLREMGIQNAIINMGGDLRAIGSKGGTPWKIGIRHPRKEGIIASLETRGDESVFTSGDYERYFEYKGKRYHHILDPRTGYPAEGVTSVTVIHQEGVVADAAATALFIAGPDQWLGIARGMGVQDVMLIDSAGRIHLTPSMQQRIHFEEPAPGEILVSETP
jgi:thiamine biosynthesis lipoprotein